MNQRSYYQSHECEGFRAKVTIEWDIPERVDETSIPNRIAVAEDIADSILAFSGKRMRDMVQAMRGYSVSQAQPSPVENTDVSQSFK